MLNTRRQWILFECKQVELVFTWSRWFFLAVLASLLLLPSLLRILTNCHLLLAQLVRALAPFQKWSLADFVSRQIPKVVPPFIQHAPLRLDIDFFLPTMSSIRSSPPPRSLICV